MKAVLDVAEENMFIIGGIFVGFAVPQVWAKYYLTYLKSTMLKYDLPRLIHSLPCIGKSCFGNVYYVDESRFKSLEIIKWKCTHY